MPAATSRGNGATFPILAGVVLLGLLAAAWYFTMGPGAKGGAERPGIAAAPEGDGTTNEPEPPDPEVEALKADLQALRESVQGIQARIDAMPKAVDPDAVESLRSTVEPLKNVPTMVQTLSGRIEGIEERIGGVESEVNSVREDLDGLRQTVESARAAESTAPAPSEARPMTDEAPRPDAALAQVAGLFARREYAQAQTLLQGLRETSPDDARVWYYSALTNGYATNNWEGETLQFVRRGAERERAGTPAAAEIDAAFVGLSAQAKSWLDYQRRQR